MKQYLWNGKKMKALFVMLALGFAFLSECTTLSVNATGSTFTGIYNQTSRDLTWSITPEGHLTISGTGNYINDYNTYYPSWCEYSEYIVSAEVNVTGITSMSYMFANLTKLESVDFKNTDTSNVTTMNRMFAGCNSLQSLNLSSFDTKKVEDMAYMFNMCNSLQSLDVKGANFNTASVTNMTYMFANCEKLPSLDVSGFDTSSVTNMEAMFAFCRDLEILTLGSSFKVDKVKDMSIMFRACKLLKGIDLSSFSTSEGVEGAVTDMQEMFGDCTLLKSVSFPEKFDTSNVKNMHAMFRHCYALEEVDVSGFDTSNVVKMNEMFSGCYALKQLDIKNFDTSNVENIGYMFTDCKALQSLDLSHFKTDKVTGFSKMFQNCSSLQSLDISGFRTGNVQYMEKMFENCSKLQSVDVSKFDTSKVTNMNGMFDGCHAITELDLSSFDTSSYTQDAEFVLQMNNLAKITTGQDKRAYRLVTRAESWRDDDGNVYSDDATIEPEANTTLYIHSGTFDINYIYEGEPIDEKELVNCPSTYDMGTVLSLSGYVTKACYTFKGWYEDEQLTKKITEIPADRYGDITLYAKMSPATYTITYKNVEGVSNIDQLPASYTYGEGVALGTPVKAGYLFEAWYEDEALTKKLTKISADQYGDITLYAKMSPKTYTITYKNVEGASNIDQLPESYVCGQTLELGSPIKTYYLFEGWYEDDKFTKKITEIPADRYGDITLYAKMNPEMYTITYMNIEGANGTDQLPESYVYGVNLELSAPSKMCHILEGWYFDAELTNKVTAIVPGTSGDILLYAKWTESHDLDKANGIVIKEATTVTEGEIQYKCKNCDYTEKAKLPRVVTDESKITDETIMNSGSDGDIKGSDFTKFQARADKTTKSTIRLKWNKVDGADGYKIYGNKCGKKNKCELLKTVKDGGKTTWKQKKLKKGTYYKFIVRAYKLVDGEEITLAVSKTIHAATDGGKKGNAKSVKIKTDKKMKKLSSGYKLTLKSNKKYTIKANEVADEKKISRHRKIRFESTDKDIAQVSFLGKVTTKNPGTCYIYVYAQNGIYKKITVVVK